MKVVLRNSSVVYEEVQWTKVTKSDTTYYTVVLGQASDFTELTHMKVKLTVKSTGSTIVNPIPRIFLAVGEGTNESVTQYVGNEITNVNLTIGTPVAIEFTFTLSAAIAADKNLKFAVFSSNVNELIALRSYTWDLEYLCY